MKKKELISGVIILLVVAALAGFLLAQVYALTLPRIEEQKRLEAEGLYRALFPEGVKFEPGRTGDLKTTAVFDHSGQKIGLVVEKRVTGYGGEMLLVVGVSPEGSISGVKILQHNETPGLGAKVAREDFLKQFQDLKYNEVYLKNTTPEGKIDAISGATISSRAVTDGVRKVLESVRNQPGKTGEEDL